MPMNWDAIGAIGEVVGAIAVVLSLSYLALQIRQSNAYNKREGMKDALSNFVEKHTETTETPAKARRFRAGLHDFRALDVDDRGAFHSSMVSLTSGFFSVWQLYQENVLDTEVYESMRMAYLALLRCPGARQWWAEYGSFYPDGYVRLLNSFIADTKIVAKPVVENLSAFREHVSRNDG